MKKLFYFFLCLMTLAGCWDRTELNDVSIITGIAIEKGEEAKYRLTVEALNAAQLSSKQGSGKGSTPAITYALEGNSISELTNKMNVALTRKLIYSHTRVLVVDEVVAREGIISFLDYMERSGEFRNDFNIVVSRNTKASDILKVTYPLQGAPSMKLTQQLETMLIDWGGYPDNQLTDFISSITSKGRNPVSVAVIIKGDVEEGKTLENNKTTEQETIVVIDGMAVFKDDKLLGFLTLEDARSYLWTQDLNRTSLTVPCEEEKYLDVRIITSRTTIKTEFKDNKPFIQVNVGGEGRIDGTQCKGDLTKIETIKEYEKEVNDFIENLIEGTIHKVQEEYGVDIFGFGEKIKIQNYNEFKKVEKDWDEKFGEAEIVVNSEFFIRRTGTHSKSFITELEKDE